MYKNQELFYEKRNQFVNALGTMSDSIHAEAAQWDRQAAALRATVEPKEREVLVKQRENTAKLLDGYTKLGQGITNMLRASSETIHDVRATLHADHLADDCPDEKTAQKKLTFIVWRGNQAKQQNINQEHT